MGVYPWWTLCVPNPPVRVAFEDDTHPSAASVGQFAIQLAALSGYKVAKTASPKNFELVKGLGASAVFDYRDPDVVANIKAATHDSVRAALDTISLKETQAISAAVISPEGGKVMHILAVVADGRRAPM